MKKTWIVLAIVAVVVVLVVGWIWSGYNGLVTSGENVDSKWAQVETQYQRRLDLIPNVVATVKGIVKQEQAVFGELADARTRYMNATNVADKSLAATQADTSFIKVLALGEQYPQLRSSESFQQLTTELEGSENRISVARKDYNDAVQSFNVTIKRFPTNVLAGMFSFGEREYFQADAAAASAPTVQF